MTPPRQRRTRRERKSRRGVAAIALIAVACSAIAIAHPAGASYSDAYTGRKICPKRRLRVSDACDEILCEDTSLCIRVLVGGIISA
jgi:hypothetical protein